MKTLKIILENCFGIGKFQHTFDYSDTNSHLVYAPNGTMKTSFAKTFDLIAKNDKKNMPRDLVSAKKSLYNITIDDTEIDRNAILVINAEDNTFDGAQRLSSFIASKELKEQYDLIYAQLDESKSELLKKLKAISHSSDCEGEYVGSFKDEQRSNFFEILSDHIKTLDPKIKKVDFKYNHVFDTKGNVKSFLAKNEGLLDNYINNYNELLVNSKLFKLSDNNTFGTYQVSEILKSIEDNSFFDAGHKFVLEDGTEINDSSELKQIFNDEVERILADQKLKDSFDKIDKAIGANAELRTFKKVLEKDNSLVVGLKNYDDFKQEVWTGYLSELKAEAEALAKMYNDKKNELENIIEQASKETSLWKKIIDKFNSRFYVPFEVVIQNQHDVILRKETANLHFIYKQKGEDPVPQSKENLLKILSKGEQRAYFILQFLFEIESRQLLEQDTLLIFDDIADSFDYKNKYAIIEYIQDLHRSEKFRLIILTHNFDFYRTLASRLSLYNYSLMATRGDHREVRLSKGLYMNDIFKEYLKNYNDPKIFISLIAFIRNLIEYTDSPKVPDCITLHSCLHQRPGSEDILIKNVFEIFSNRISKLNGKSIELAGEMAMPDFIFSTSESIIGEENIDEILLENKIVLAVACRLKAEQYLINKLPNIDLAAIKVYQTKELSTLYKHAYPESLALGLIDKVNLMTPENIHLNSFMYEPLVDMSVYHLVDLYNSIKQLN